MKLKIAFHIVCLYMLTFGTCNLSAQEVRFQGDIDSYVKKIPRSLEFLYNSLCDGATERDEISMFAEGFSHNYVWPGGVFIPDFMDYSSNTAQYSLENYLLQFANKYRGYISKGAVLEFHIINVQPQDAYWTKDKKGIMINIVYDNILTADNVEVFRGKSQAIVVFPKQTDWTDIRIKQLSSFKGTTVASRPRSSSGSSRSSAGSERSSRQTVSPNLGGTAGNVKMSFTQKKAVKEAQDLAAKGVNAEDFRQARSLIKRVMEQAETKYDAQTWYVAGYIEEQQFGAERKKQILGQKANEPVMYEALGAILPYFKTAYELDQLPNDKGKVIPKYTQDIKKILSAVHVYYFNGAAYYFDKNDYKKAYDYFNMYLEISDLPMFVGTQTAQKDSTFIITQFYAAIAATQLGDSKTAIKALSRAKNTDYRLNDVYQYLAYEYKQAGDSVNYIKTLKEGLVKFPNEDFYLMSLIDTYVRSGQNEKAIENLTTAIAKNPENGQLYHVMGIVYETGMKDYAKAEEFFKKALENNSESAESLSSLGRIYYHQGVSKLSEANMINDSKKYQAELTIAKGFFKKALPYFQKAHKLKPDESKYMIALRGIYYNLDMGPELKDIEAKMNK